MSALKPAIALGLAAALVTLLLAAPAPARVIRDRTQLVAAARGDSQTNAPTIRPTISGDGRRVAFDSAATNLTTDPNGGTRDVFLRDLRTGDIQLMSINLNGVGADGDSGDAAISGRGTIVAFSSAATNLVTGDLNGLPDIFVRPTFSGPELVSRGVDGLPANGPSIQPDITQDGDTVVFTSAATNLTRETDTNQTADVFAYNTQTGKTLLISRGRDGAAANGPSGSPSISPDGRFVSFSSTANNVVKRDTNGVGDVFVADLKRDTMQRVTRNSRGRQQNKAVIAPFTQVSDMAGNGLVTFDSDATNLVKGDRNRDTDVFVHSLITGETARVSLATGLNAEGNNDSFSPRITPNGRYVSFESFAENLYPGDAAGEDIYVRDLKLRATSLVSVKARRGRPRGREAVRQLLQRPALSDNGRLVAFTSTSPLVPSEGGDAEDAYIRNLTPPRARIRAKNGVYTLRADDPIANVFRCQVKQIRRVSGTCPMTANLRFLKRPVVTLGVRAMGPGTLLGPLARKRIRVPLP